MFGSLVPRSLLRKVAVTAVITGLSSLASAQTWNLPDTTQWLTGVPYDQTGTAGLVVSGGNLWYWDYDGSNSGPAATVATVTELHEFPVTWKGSESVVYFGDDPSQSPTGDKVLVTASTSAVAFHLNGPNFTGYMVGLVTTYQHSSAGQSNTMRLFEPGQVAPDAASAKETAYSLATAAPPALPAVTGSGDPPDCAQTCMNNYNTEVKNAKDTYLTNLKTYCGVVAPPGGFIAGCGIGVAICGWIFPPASTAACCVAGGIIGSAVGTGTCVYLYTEQYESALRIARNNYINCMRNCGYIIAEQ